MFIENNDYNTIENKEDREKDNKDKEKEIEKNEDKENEIKDEQSEKDEILNSNIVLRVSTRLINCVEKTYLFILPNYQKFPKIAFLFSLIISFLHSKFVVYLVEDISIQTKISASFFGMSLISWAGNVGDCINASVAAKMKKVDLLTTGILASQIMNLQICLGIPWIIYMIKGKIEENKKLFIHFGKEYLIRLFISLLITIFLSVFVIFLFNRRLNRLSGLILLIIYILYFIYEIIHSRNSTNELKI